MMELGIRRVLLSAHKRHEGLSEKSILKFSNNGAAQALINKRKKKEEEKQWKQELLKKAREGNGSAMALVGDCYFTGSKGFKRDAKKAYAWFVQANSAGNVWGTVNVGYMMVLGEGVSRNEQEGMMCICLAAGKGNDSAAALLGQCYADGVHGIPRDDKQAIHWLQMALSDKCSLKSMTKESRNNAKILLDEVLARSVCAAGLSTKQ